MPRPLSLASTAIRAAKRWLHRFAQVAWRVASAVLIGAATMRPPPPPPPPPPAVCWVEESDALSAESAQREVE
jgi:hypothetical protein